MARQYDVFGELGVGEVARVEIVVEPEVAGTIRNGAAVSFGQTRIDTDVEETTVLESAVVDEPDGDNGNGDDNGNGGGNDDDFNDGASDDQYDDDDVIKVPDKPLPDTGGFPPLLAAGFFLVAGAGLGVSIVRRRY